MQIDGRAVTLGKRLALSGARYSGGGVTLKITRKDTTLKHAKRATTACELI
jgi:membrane-bound inhibitor of C-type lysozyme